MLLLVPEQLVHHDLGKRAAMRQYQGKDTVPCATRRTVNGVLIECALYDTMQKCSGCVLPENAQSVSEYAR